MSRITVLLLALTGLLSLPSGFSGEPIPPPMEPEHGAEAEPPEAAARKRKERPGAAERKEGARRVREIIAKQRAGGELSEEERAFVEKHAPRMMRMLEGGADRRGRGMPRGRERARRDPVGALIPELNVVDRASLTAALMLFQGERREEALAAVAKVADKSPDTDAVGFARLLMGRFLMRMEQPDNANELFRAVTGRAAPFALLHLLQTVVGENRGERIVAVVTELVAVQKSALDRCRVLQALLDGTGRLGLEPPAWAEVLAAAAGAVSYDDALGARDVLAQERKAFREMMERRNEEAERVPERGRGRRKGDVPPGRAKKGRTKELGDLPPEKRREMIEQTKTNIQKRLEQLGEDAKPEDRERLLKHLEKIERQERKLEKKREKGEGKGRRRGKGVERAAGPGEGAEF